MGSPEAPHLFHSARSAAVEPVLAAVRSQPDLVHSRDHANGSTLLHIFSRLSLSHAVAELLSLGAELEARDRNFRSALHLAARADAEPVGAGTEGKAEAQRETARPLAIIATLRVLLKAGARVGARDEFGLTALHHAAQAGHAAVCEFLLSLNTSLRQPRAPIEAETNAEERPLHMAAQGGHEDTVRCLLEHGAHPSRTNYLGETPLHLAVRSGDGPRHLATIRLMCERVWKLDLNPQTARERSTPLHIAAQFGHFKAAKALLAAPNIKRLGGQRGVDLSITDRAGRTARDVAVLEGYDDVVALIDTARERAAAAEARAAKEQEEGLKRAMREMRIANSGVARGGGGVSMDAVIEEGDQEGDVEDEAM